tara:strand:- start:5 stop:421 length:417 start_codon:yes stop_codon:yes gene_type:complete
MNLDSTQILYTLDRIKRGESLRGYPTNLIKISDFVPQARIQLITELDNARIDLKENVYDDYNERMIKKRMDDIRTDLLFLQNLSSIDIEGINRISELRTRDVMGITEQRQFVITPTTDIVMRNPDGSAQMGNLGGFGN